MHVKQRFAQTWVVDGPRRRRVQPGAGVPTGPLAVDADVYNELRGTGAFDTMTVDEDEVS
jgi:hypothetical protein